MMLYFIFLTSMIFASTGTLILVNDIPNNNEKIFSCTYNDLNGNEKEDKNCNNVCNKKQTSKVWPSGKTLTRSEFQKSGTIPSLVEYGDQGRSLTNHTESQFLKSEDYYHHMKSCKEQKTSESDSSDDTTKSNKPGKELRKRRQP